MKLDIINYGIKHGKCVPHHSLSYTVFSFEWKSWSSFWTCRKYETHYLTKDVRCAWFNLLWLLFIRSSIHVTSTRCETIVENCRKRKRKMRTHVYFIQFGLFHFFSSWTLGLFCFFFSQSMKITFFIKICEKNEDCR